MLICAIFLLVSGIISKYLYFKCFLIVMVVYLLAVTGVLIYISLKTDHNEDVIECEGIAWVVLSANNVFVTLVVLILATLTLRRRKLTEQNRNTIHRALGHNDSVLLTQENRRTTNKFRDVVTNNTFIEEED